MHSALRIPVARLASCLPKAQPFVAITHLNTPQRASQFRAMGHQTDDPRAMGHQTVDTAGGMGTKEQQQFPGTVRPP